MQCCFVLAGFLAVAVVLHVRIRLEDLENDRRRLDGRIDDLQDSYYRLWDIVEGQRHDPNHGIDTER